ncbi:MAG TPA: c-type cytochrome [Candidatus Sulfotelmatobacter sp.]|nr:c-type cytochrome [Candidatus Sulfotelmatobacter sp.]
MRHAYFLFCAFLLVILVAFAQTPNQTTPYWAYALNPPSDASAAKPDNSLHHVPRSDKAFTTAQTEDLFNPPDWHPSGHPPMPEAVAHGRKPDVYACGYCHLPNGEGRPENATLAGLSSSYIVRQIADFRSGARKTSEPHHLPAVTMASIAAKATDPDIRSAAQYFSEIRPKPWIRVVETATVPKTHVSGWMLVPTLPPATEPIGHRIIEIPENLGLTELRDDDSGFIAYVPEGSLQKGKSLVITGEKGRTVPCAKCHGPGLRGSGNVPPIAGRSPSYIIRQLYDIRSGARSGTLSRQMLPQVRKLELDDMIAIVAYVSSLKP